MSFQTKISAVSLRTEDAAIQQLHKDLYQANIALVIFYCSPVYDLTALAAALRDKFADIPVIGCTTAGEIGPQGYQNDGIVAVSIAADDFQVHTVRCQMIKETKHLPENLANKLSEKAPRASKAQFGFLLMDGLSQHEESFLQVLQQHMGGIPLFGGSAADGENFQQTWIYHEGEFHQQCALLTFIETSQPFKVFKTEHFHSTDKTFKVTKADYHQRCVYEINGKPAATEYARLIDMAYDKLSPLMFAAYPLIKEINGERYVRSIQKVNDDGSLSLFSSIKEGEELNIAKGIGLLDNLNNCFKDIRADIGEPALVLGCDCFLRRVEMERTGIKELASLITTQNNVIGFNTYGEQFNTMHVNHTFTGVAIAAS